jgi:hypothetical protein
LRFLSSDFLCCLWAAPDTFFFLVCWSILGLCIKLHSKHIDWMYAPMKSPPSRPAHLPPSDSLLLSANPSCALYPTGSHLSALVTIEQSAIIKIHVRNCMSSFLFGFCHLSNDFEIHPCYNVSIIPCFCCWAVWIYHNLFMCLLMGICLQDLVMSLGTSPCMDISFHFCWVSI